MGYGFIFYMFAVPSSIYEKYLTTANDAGTVISHLKGIGFNVDTDPETAGNNIINDAVSCFRAQLATFAPIWIMPRPSVKAHKVTKKRAGANVRSQRKKTRKFYRGQSTRDPSDTSNGRYARPGYATNYAIGFSNDNMAVNTLIGSVHQANPVSLEKEFHPSTPEANKGNETPSIFNQDAVNAAQLMQSFGVTSFLSASQLMQTFDLESFDFTNTDKLTGNLDVVQSSNNILQNAEMPMQR
ncbi:hypothetical protein EYZ11_010447 [Aspergillus tanneri]|nr:hypothetical protein EYZ11_010447 [Aspergillus tanneri]